MKLYRTTRGVRVDRDGVVSLMRGTEWDVLVGQVDPSAWVRGQLASIRPSESPDLAEGERILAPIGEQEVWAAGVPSLRSKQAGMEESESAGGGGADFYDRVYAADRPELFFKATAHRVAGPGEPVRIRRDSKWNVPEPELALLVNPRGRIVGYTIGNDMSCRDIEGENPLYLPQAKVYDASCALGPCVLVAQGPLAKTTK